MNKNFYIRKKCPISNEVLIPFLNLKNQPLANELKDSKKNKTINYPLILCYSKKSKILQLNTVINPTILFKKYLWVTNTSQTARVYANTFFKFAKKYLNKKSQILEIAHNDGTFLNKFASKGYFSVGVDPAKNILKKNAEFINENYFFSDKVAKKLVKKYNKFDFVYARNVIPHVEKINEVVKGINISLKAKGIGCIEFHYLGEIIKKLQYDSIYHEHLYYFSIRTISILLKKHGLIPFDIKKSPISGGSFVIYFCKYKKNKTKYFKKMELNETNNRLNTLANLIKFKKNVENHRRITLDLIKIFKLNNKKIYGYGASARSSTFLNYCEISNHDIDLIFDANPLKFKKYSPGSNIKIVSTGTITKVKPKIVLILAWNFKDEVISFLKQKIKTRFKVILPFPNKTKLIEFG